MSLFSTPRRRVFAVCLGVAAAAAGPPAAQAATVAPSADAYATAKKADRNFGASRYLIVKRAPATRSYLRFALGAVPASGLRATLRVYPLSSSARGLRVSRADALWAERAITFRSAPAARRGAVSSGPLRARRWVNIDVSRLVGRGGTMSLALTAGGTGRIVLASREDAARAPQLVLRGAGSAAAAAPSASPAGATQGGMPSRFPTPPAPVPSPEPAPSQGTVITAAGDIASDTYGDSATASLIDAINPDAVLTLGDNAYPTGTLSDYNDFYAPTWGRFNAKVKPVPGNHEYKSGGSGYWDYFGALGGDRDKGYYSYELAGWHLVALNSNLPSTAGSPQETWLRSDLAAHRAQCTLAYWHSPRWNIHVKGDDASVAGLWDALYDSGADVVLSGHSHNYQRYSRLDKNGARDDARGIREFIVGTGGAPEGSTPLYLKAPAESVNEGTFGVLKMNLRPDSYDWQFVPEAGKTFTDSGSESCH